MSTLERISAGPVQSGCDSVATLPHVLLVVDGFPKTLGGGERIVLRMAELLPRYGYRASILTFALHPEGSFQPEDSPCPLYLLPLTSTYDRAALKGALALRSFLREHQIRVVQTFFESSDLWAGLITRLASPAKLVWSRRDMGILRGRKHSAAYRALRRLPHAVFAVSGEVARHVIQVDGVPASRVRIIHNGLPFGDILAKIQRSSSSWTITTIGNIRRVKGHDVLIRAASEVLARFPEVRFTVAGAVLEEEYFAELKALLEALGIADRFTFLGQIEHLGDHLQGSDVFVLPSRSEGFSNALIEAMAHRLPVIATTVGGNAEAIENQVSGVLVPPEDASAIAAALIRWLEYPDEARLIAEAAEARATREFSADAMMQKTAAAYAEILTR